MKTSFYLCSRALNRNKTETSQLGPDRDYNCHGTPAAELDKTVKSSSVSWEEQDRSGSQSKNCGAADCGPTSQYRDKVHVIDQVPHALSPSRC
jgi:hypothetical protein